METKNYMNPYLAGLLLGLLLLFTFYISGRGLGASGAFKSFTISAVENISPQHTSNSKFYKEYSQEHSGSPLMNWLVFEIIGVVVGAFLSGLISGRLKLQLEKGPRVNSSIRVVGALIGGILWGVGSQLGRGCTSGAALSGLAVMSTGGIITMISIFAGGYLFAYFFRKFWV